MKRRTLFKLFGVAGVSAIAGGGTVIKRSQAANRYYSGPVTDHFDGRVFYNPEGIAPRGFGDLLRWQLGGGRKPWPESWPSPHPPAKPVERIEGDALRITMVGHACLLIQTAGLNILTDPVWSDRVSPVRFAGPKRVNSPGIAFEDLPPIDLVLVTHNHYDHLDLTTLARLAEEHDPVVLTPLGNDAIINQSLPLMRVSAHDWGDMAETKGVRVHLEPAHHWSARGAFDRRMALWAAFVIDTPGGKIYHVGDTGFHEGRNYREAARRHGRFRLANLPFGSYEPRWFMKGQHQDPDEAVEGFALLGAANAAGHHWGTFQLTNEAIDEPRDKLFAALDRKGIARDRFRPLQPGEIWDVPASGQG